MTITIADQLREALIAETGQRMLAAHDAGEHEAARFWLDEQAAQINKRSQAMVAHMEACFFADAGDRARVLSWKGVLHA
jgi:hypothetical protein